jgi:hypothetical protein
MEGRAHPDDVEAYQVYARMGGDKDDESQD